MTRPANDPLREMAEKMALMTAELLNVEPEDWQYVKYRGAVIEELYEALRTAHRQGEISMRERAAKESIRHGKSKEHNKGREKDDGGTCYTHLAEAIRALEPETEGKP